MCMLVGHLRKYCVGDDRRGYSHDPPPSRPLRLCRRVEVEAAAAPAAPDACRVRYCGGRGWVRVLWAYGTGHLPSDQEVRSTRSRLLPKTRSAGRRADARAPARRCARARARPSAAPPTPSGRATAAPAPHARPAEPIGELCFSVLYRDWGGGEGSGNYTATMLRASAKRVFAISKLKT